MERRPEGLGVEVRQAVELLGVEPVIVHPGIMAATRDVDGPITASDRWISSGASAHRLGWSMVDSGVGARTLCSRSLTGAARLAALGETAS